jgi:hypothetical protein
MIFKNSIVPIFKLGFSVSDVNRRYTDPYPDPALKMNADPDPGSN